MSSLLERIIAHMPKTHDFKMGNYYIETRLTNVLRYIYPYFVGNVVKFKIRITVDEKGLDGSKFYIKEIFNSEARQIETFDKAIVGKGWIRAKTHPIDQEGDVRYKIGFAPNSGDQETMVSGRAKNTDRWVVSCLSAVVTFIVTVGAGIVLGFIDVEPILRMFITP